MAKRGRTEKYTRADAEAWLATHKTGRTYQAIAAELHIPYVTVNVVLKRHGLTNKQLKTTSLGDLAVTGLVVEEKVAA